MPSTTAKPSPVPLPWPLVVKNGSNSLSSFLHLRTHAGARVFDLHPRLSLTLAGADGESAAGGHGIARVDH